MKYLVTGGAGFIGSHLVDKLLKNNNKVVVYDNFSTGKSKNLKHHPNLQVINGDIRDILALKKASYDVDGIFHLAAVVLVQYSIDNPLLTEDVNCIGTLNVLQIAKTNNIKIVLASSASVYKSSNVRLDEKSQIDPKSPYALSKYHNEQQALLFKRLYNTDVVSLRYFNVYGNRQDNSSPYSSVISIFKKHMLNKTIATVYGDGTQIRDFIHVNDVIDVTISLMKKSKNLVYNVGTGIETSITDLVKICNLTVQYKKKRLGEPLYSCANIDLISNEMEYKPRFKMQDFIFKK